MSGWGTGTRRRGDKHWFRTRGRTGATSAGCCTHPCFALTCMSLYCRDDRVSTICRAGRGKRGEGQSREFVVSLGFFGWVGTSGVFRATNDHGSIYPAGYTCSDAAASLACQAGCSPVPHGGRRGGGGRNVKWFNRGEERGGGARAISRPGRAWGLGVCNPDLFLQLIELLLHLGVDSHVE